jgi:2-polyprenyl-3-methyl-5-hydroxy-6-metoxy-1,4-benzoquinol methylase
MHSYAEKSESYFGNARKDISPLLPPQLGDVLEIGCGSGATLAWLKSADRCRSTTGIELFESAAAQAARQVDKVLCGAAETMLDELPVGQQFDVVLCLDILEHMVDPWAFLSRLVHRVKPGGLLISSLPNVRFIGVLGPLLVQGQWRYRDDGVLDRTHLRFFTRKSALELMRTGGLAFVACRGNAPPHHTAVGKFDRWTLGLFKEFSAFQWLISSRRPGPGR